ncbi:MAG: gamma-glutamyl-gamma-aminobutyrate hydrolase family protein [Clostridia bacterium]|nr:gamma-glutamyl-gamma-aminobutyrate hydrolase family protein [Clostridia bacterium]
MRKPIILITGGRAYDRHFHGLSLTLNKTYTAAVAAGGGIPTMALDVDAYDEYAAMADGLVLSGSQGFSPDPKLNTGTEHTDRNVDDQKMIEAFRKAGKPIMGICLGMQQLNVAFGGDLYPNFKYDHGVEHMMTKHTIDTVPGSLIHRMFGTGFFINSRHNVKLGKLADELVITATSDDGTVAEALEHKTLPIIGFQWHPERMRGEFPEPPEGPDMTPLFTHFIEMVKADMAAREA